jgi:hypothetical protein
VRDQTSRAVRLGSLLAAAALTLAGAPAAALGATTTSSNWSGYVAHKTGVTFRNVSADWKQPAATCTAQYPSYSAIWVGLGGDSLNSNALEQIGTEVDCSAAGSVVSSAWHELVPAPPSNIRITVNPGDLISASVTVVGHRVTLQLTDRTDTSPSPRPPSNLWST